MVRVEAVLDSWKTVRQDTAQAVEDMPPGELDFKPLPDVLSFREIARHILNAGHGMTGALLEGGDIVREKVMAHFLHPPDDADGATLAALLRTHFDERLAALTRQPPEFFDGMIARFDGQQVTRLEMLQFIKEHELTHRAQLFLYLRMKGVVPVTTRRRQAKK